MDHSTHGRLEHHETFIVLETLIIITPSEKHSEVLKESVQTHGKSPAPPWPPGFVPWRPQPGICRSQRPRWWRCRWSAWTARPPYAPRLSDSRWCARLEDWTSLCSPDRQWLKQINIQAFKTYMHTQFLHEKSHASERTSHLRSGLRCNLLQLFRS